MDKTGTNRDKQGQTGNARRDASAPGKAIPGKYTDEHGRTWTYTDRQGQPFLWTVRHFTPDEFACPCCGKIVINRNFLSILDRTREEYKRPITITSGYRCPSHNKNVGGKDTSSHIKGNAVDISCTTDSDRFKLITTLLKKGVFRIGIDKNFVHADTDMEKTDQLVWVY
jgi:hypothetical protein